METAARRNCAVRPILLFTREAAGHSVRRKHKGMGFCHTIKSRNVREPWPTSFLSLPTGLLATDYWLLSMVRSTFITPALPARSIASTPCSSRIRLWIRLTTSTLFSSSARMASRNGAAAAAHDIDLVHHHRRQVQRFCPPPPCS